VVAEKRLSNPWAPTPRVQEDLNVRVFLEAQQRYYHRFDIYCIVLLKKEREAQRI